MASNYFVQISVMENLQMPSSQPDIQEIQMITASVDIIKTRVVVTPVSPVGAAGNIVSNMEGSSLTGRSLIVYGKLRQMVTYTTTDVYQGGSNTVEFLVPFTTFIVVPKKVNADPYAEVDTLCLDFAVDAVVEDIYYKQISPKEFFKNVTLYLEANAVGFNCDNDTSMDIEGICLPSTLNGLLQLPTNIDPNKDKRWTQFQVSNNIVIPGQFPDIVDLVSSSITFELLTQKVIKTPDGDTILSNYEGNYLTGRKLIIEGILNQRVVYRSNQNTLHWLNFGLPFSAYIMLAKNEYLATRFDIESCIEDTFIVQQDNRSFFTASTLFIKAVPIGVDSCLGTAASCGFDISPKNTGLCKVNDICLQVTKNGQGSWRQVSSYGVAAIPASYPDIESVNRISVSADIIFQKIIDTPTNINLAGMILTGKKLVVEVNLEQKIIYTAALSSQPVYSFLNTTLFSVFIVLPSRPATSYCVEDIFAKALDVRNVFTNITLFLQAKSN